MVQSLFKRNNLNQINKIKTDLSTTLGLGKKSSHVKLYGFFTLLKVSTSNPLVQAQGMSKSQGIFFLWFFNQGRGCQFYLSSSIWDIFFYFIFFRPNICECLSTDMLWVEGAECLVSFHASFPTFKLYNKNIGCYIYDLIFCGFLCHHLKS